jgi:serine/threonine-protein kinase
MPTDSSSTDPAQQLAHACQELRRRLQTGDDCRAEELLAAFPTLAASEEHAVELICTELRLRRQRGESSTAEHCLARFPQWRDQLEHRLCREGLLSPSSLPVRVTVPDLSASAALADATDPEGGVQTLGRYEELGVIGRGGMGIVCKARDRLLDRIVALKKIRGGPGAHTEEVRRFFREARVLARLHHPHIVPVYDIGRDGDEPFFTMDCVAGGSLKDRSDLFGGDVRTVVVLMEKVARAVHAAHEQGIIHRDLKPGNVLLDEKGEPLVSDFGLAKLADADESLTREGQALGTPPYMAPEQVDGQARDATVQSDVWSLGVMLYELLTGQRPFPGKGLRDVSEPRLAPEPPQPRALRPQLEPGLESVVLKCLEQEPRQRYASAAALADDLVRWLRGEPLTVRPRSWLSRTRRVLRRYPQAIGACLVLGLAALVVLASYRRGGSDQRPSPQPDDPDRPVTAFQGDLQALRPAVLLGETGGPLWSRQALGQGTIQKSPLRDDTFCLSSFELCLLELLPAPLPQRYLFQAEVRHHRGEKGEVGIYFGYHKQETAQGVEHCFCDLAFNDWGPEQALLQFRLHRHRERGPLDELDYPASTGKFTPLDQLPRGRERPWRLLKARVTPEAIEVAWGDKWFGKWQRAEIVKLATPRLQDNPALNPGSEFLPQGGLGVFIKRGTGCFRHVLVKPLE